MFGPIDIVNDILVYSSFHHNRTEVGDPDITIPKIRSDIERSQDALSRPSSNNKLVISFLGEGHGLQEAKALWPFVKSLFPDKVISVIFGTPVMGEHEFPYRCHLTWMIDHRDWLTNLIRQQISWEKIILDRKFLCLNRRPSLVRERLVWQLLQQLKNYSARISMGSIDSTYSFPGKWLHEPILVDGVVNDQQKCQALDPRFYSCLFNIITESSDQSDPITWNSIFLTEKTFKPFGLMQIPLWMAVPHTVKAVRDLGFDVFDDICRGHSYDDIQDEDTRQDALLDLIRGLDQRYSILCCRRLRKQLYPRLLANYQHLQELNNNQRRVYHQILESF